MQNVTSKLTQYFNAANMTATIVLLGLTVLVIRLFKIKVW